MTSTAWNLPGYIVCSSSSVRSRCSAGTASRKRSNCSSVQIVPVLDLGQDVRVGPVSRTSPPEGRLGEALVVPGTRVVGTGGARPGVSPLRIVADCSAPRFEKVGSGVRSRPAEPVSHRERPCRGATGRSSSALPGPAPRAQSCPSLERVLLGACRSASASPSVAARASSCRSARHGRGPPARRPFVNCAASARARCKAGPSCASG